MKIQTIAETAANGNMIARAYVALMTAFLGNLCRGDETTEQFYNAVAGAHEQVEEVMKEQGDPFFEGFAAQAKVYISED